MQKIGIGTRTAVAALVLGGLGAATSSLLQDDAVSIAFAQDSIGRKPWGEASNVVFAKYDGIDGESSDDNHAKWIDVLNVDWGVRRQRSKGGALRRRGAAIVEDLTLTIEYEKASPKLVQAALQGKVIPKLEIEQTATYGGSRATYLKYELKNVIVTSYEFAPTEPGERHRVVIGNNFEEVKVTYTEYDGAGSSKGNVEVEWKVEKGTK